MQLNLNTVALLEFFIVHLSTIKESMAYYGQFLQEQYDFNYKQSTFVILITLQELKLQGIKIRDGVVFSRYSRAQCFSINLSDFVF